MSSNIEQIFIANPASALQNDDLIYLGRSPYAAGDDFAINAQSIFPSSVVTAMNLAAYSDITGKKLADSLIRFAGGFTFTGTMTANTAVTFPTSGTLATTSQIPSVPTFPLSMANGGTAKALVASNGGLVYSDGDSLEILSGTPTALQIPLSGANAAPAWSTMTYLATIGVNEIPFASSANVLGVIAAVNSAVMISSAGGIPSMSQTLPSAVQANITALGAQSQALNMNTHLINNVVDPSAAQDAATKNYVDSVAQGRVYKDPVVAATTADFAATYANGASGVGATLTGTVMAAFAPDGVTLAVGDRVLFKDQASTFQNGIYTTTTLGTGAVLPVFTRALDMDLAAEFKGATTFIIGGTVNAGRTYTETATVVTVGTDAVTFVLTGDATNGTLTVVTQLVTATGTYTPTAGLVSCDVEIVGGGGGGGGADGGAALQSAAGGGGGGGGYSFSTYSAAEIGANAAVAIGALGAGGAAGNNNGAAGGNSSFNPAGTGATMTANGGAAGNGSAPQAIAASFTNPQLGGTASGGQVNVSGNASTFGVADGTVGRAMGGGGGSSKFGAGGLPQQNTAGAAGIGYGAGGAGGAAGAATTAGGNGVAGVCVIREYILT